MTRSEKTKWAGERTCQEEKTMQVSTTCVFQSMFIAHIAAWPPCSPLFIVLVLVVVVVSKRGAYACVGTCGVDA